jgi:hypothetical protein
VINSCKKNPDPLPNEYSPVFYCNGQIGNEDLAIGAGLDSFYLQTNYAYNQREDIVEYVSEFKKVCAGCSESLKVIIRNNKKGEVSNFVFDSVFSIKNDYRYYSNNPLAYKVYFTSESVGLGAVSHFWRFDDGNQSTISNPVKEFAINSISNVEYTSTFANNCKSTINKSLFLMNDSIANNYPNIIYYQDTVNTNYIFTIDQLSNIKNVSWDFGDSTNLLNGLSVNYFSPRQGVGLVKANIETFSGQNFYLSKNVNFGKTSDCEANFSFRITPVDKGQQLNTVIIQYTDRNGKVYSSENILQDENVLFAIKEIVSRQLNENKIVTTAFSIDADCLLSDGNQSFKKIKFNSKIAFAHP